MRILGADGFKNDVKALDNIPSALVNDGDVCLVVNPPTSASEMVYFYILDADHGGAENLPLIVVPKDNTTTPTDKRWILIGTYQSTSTILDILANSIYQADSSVPLDLNDVASLSGNTFTFTNTITAPFVTNSQVMVANLNSEYLGGIHWSEFELSNDVFTGDAFILEDVEEVTVVFPEPRFNTTYSLFTEIQNIDDTEPSIYTHAVTNKTTTGFTIKMSSKTDSPYYRLQWAVLGENVEITEYNLLDVFSDPITDKDNIQITVL